MFVLLKLFFIWKQIVCKKTNDSKLNVCEILLKKLLEYETS